MAHLAHVLGRRSIALLGVLTASCALGCASAATASALPPEGVFETCPLNQAFVTCTARLQAMSAGGLKVVVISPRNATLDELTQYAATAQGLGMSIMWEIGVSGWWTQPLTSTRLRSEFPAFAAGCGCTDNADLFAYVITFLRALPATYGYYAADDSVLAPGEGEALSQYMARLKALDPVHPAMIGWYGGLNQSGYQAMSDLLGQEIYPVTTSPILPEQSNGATWDTITQTVSDEQGLATLDGKQSAFILQAFSWGDNLSDGEAVGVCTTADTPQSCNARLPYPSAAEQLALRNAVLQNANPAVILWYNFPATYGPALPPTGSTIFPDPATAAAQWSGLSAAITAPWTPPAPAPAPVPASGASAPRPVPSGSAAATARAAGAGRHTARAAGAGHHTAHAGQTAMCRRARHRRGKHHHNRRVSCRPRTGHRVHRRRAGR